MQFSQLKIDWQEFKRGVRELWDLNEAELEASEKNLNKLENIVINKYPHKSPEVIHEMLTQLVDSFNTPTDHARDGLYQTSYERRPEV